MTAVNFHPVSGIPCSMLTYSVIAARYKGKWIFVRHTDRTTWEIPGGHIEPGESPEEAAARELQEETGSIIFNIECVSAYSVEKNGKTGYGRLYFAEVSEIGPVPDISEIAETCLLGSLPANLTYPDIQPWLLDSVIHYLKKQDTQRK